MTYTVKSHLSFCQYSTSKKQYNLPGQVVVQIYPYFLLVRPSFLQNFVNAIYRGIFVISLKVAYSYYEQYCTLYEIFFSYKNRFFLINGLFRLRL